MKIVHGSKHADGAVCYVQCIVCRRMMLLSECLIDLDGPTFAAYYHSECLVNCSEEQLA